MSERETLIAEAAELVMEQFAILLDGCDDEDTVRPEMVFRTLRAVWSPRYEGDWPEITAGELRSRIAQARSRLAVSSVSRDTTNNT